MATEYKKVRFSPDVDFLFPGERHKLSDAGTMWPLKSDIANLVLEDLNQPEIKLKRCTEDKDGNLTVDNSFYVSFWYPGGIKQTLIGLVRKILPNKQYTDYYQIPYEEASVRTMLFMDFMESCDDCWFVAQINNQQLKEWMHGWGLEMEKVRQDETIHNQHCNKLERGGEQPDN